MNDCKTLRVGLYCRVSTSQHQDTEDQEHRLTTWAQRAGHDVVGVFRDRGISGAKDKRPGLDGLLAAARDHRIDAIVITKLSRLFRSTRHLLELVDELEHLGVGLVSLGEQIDTKSPQGRLFITVLAGVDEFERDLIRERIRDGIAKARRHGTVLGRPRIPRSIESRAIAMIEANVPKRTIARELKLSPTTVYRIVEDLKTRK